MSVPEQIPTVSYTANGTTTNFPITFELSDERYLVVTKNMEIPPVGAYTVLNGNVVFGVAPNEGDIITLMRDTVLDRETNYQNYDNSFRPEAVNYDLDKIWHVLQEQQLIDAQLLARVKEEIEWRRTHDFNYDTLAQVRDLQVFDALKQYLDTILAATSPGIFEGVTAGVVFALDGKSVQTHLEQIATFLNDNALAITNEIAARQAADTAETIARQAGDVILQNQISALGVGNKAYLTYADMDADKVNIPADSKVTVTNDAITSNNGDWQWNGTTLTKSDYDPLTQAKNYTEQYFNEKTVENLYKPTRAIVNYYTSQVNGTLQPYSGALVAVIPVIAGQEYFIKCSDFKGAFSVSLNEYDYYTNTTLGIVTLTETEYPNIKKFTVPVGSNAKFMYINTYLSSQNYDIRDSLVVGTVFGISEVNGFEIIDLQARRSAVSLTSNANIYDKSTMIVDNFYLDGNHFIDYAEGWKIASIPVTPGNRIKITCDNYAYPFKAAFFSDNNYATGKAPASKVLETDGLAYYGTAPSNARFLVVSVYITFGSVFDIINSLTVTIGPSQSAIEATSINNMPIADLYARSMLGSSGRFQGKKVFAFGDSITEGTQGGYVKYLSEAFGTNVANYGSSGARTSRVVDIVTAGAGLPKRDPSTADIVWATKDYTDLVCATLMIGTNDLSGMPMGSLADIPTSNLTDYTNPLDYWALFANTYIGNIALVIEFIKSKAPKTEIHIVAPIYAYSASLGPELTQSLIPHLEAVTHYYGVHLIYGTYESGLSYKLMNSAASNPYSYDGVHLNVLGNEVFGKFLAQKVLSFG